VASVVSCQHAIGLVVRNYIWSDAALVLPGAHDIHYIEITSPAITRDRTARHPFRTTGNC
jgi:hypothetical protein